MTAENVYWSIREHLLPMNAVVEAALNEQDSGDRCELVYALGKMAKAVFRECRKIAEEADAEVWSAAWLVAARILAVATLALPAAGDYSGWDPPIATRAEFEDAAFDAFHRVWDDFEAADWVT